MTLLTANKAITHEGVQVLNMGTLEKRDHYRHFTNRETARIQSFPDSFKLIGTESSILKGIGNAVPPVLFWHVMNSLMAIKKEADRPRS